MKLKTLNINRKKFLQTFASILAIASIAGVAVVSLFKSAKSAKKSVSNDVQNEDEKHIATPYKLTASFNVDDDIKGFELWNDKLIVATQNDVHIYNFFGKRLNRFALNGDLRDITVYDDNIYLLFPESIEVYNFDGGHVRKWKAYNDRSDYCSFTVASGLVFVTDAANKEICKYSVDGSFKTIIKSPNRFVIPSYTFGIVYVNDIVYCSNSGRHHVEMFTPDGNYLGAFGQPGAVAGRFCGCCNPVHLTCTTNGDIITSEKGTPRISFFGSNGQFRSIALDSNILGGGNKAYDVKPLDDKLFVAGKNVVSTFQLDKTTSATTVT